MICYIPIIGTDRYRRLAEIRGGEKKMDYIFAVEIVDLTTGEVLSAVSAGDFRTSQSAPSDADLDALIATYNASAGAETYKLNARRC